MPAPPLSTDQIVRWADEFRAARGRWPSRKDGHVGLTGNTWSGLDACLKGGHRGLNPGSSLARLLLALRGRRHKLHLPPLTEAGILAWADAHHARAGEWPGQSSGPITGAPGETWNAVECALRDGRRGLPGGSSLAQLLEAGRGVRNHLSLPHLSPAHILGWADAHHAATGRWPTRASGPIAAAPGESWQAVEVALFLGARGLPSGGSLARLLAEHRGVRNPSVLPRLTAAKILAWADAHKTGTGRWPVATSGPVAAAPGETWSAVDTALTAGKRGLPGGDSLARLLARRRGKRNRQALPALSAGRIRGWIERHHERTGGWPRPASGLIPDAPGETWNAVDKALRPGRRGLPGGSSLAQAVRECRPD